MNSTGRELPASRPVFFYNRLDTGWKMTQRTYSPEAKAARAARSRRWYEANRETVLQKLRERTPEERHRLYEARRAKVTADPAYRERERAWSAAYRARHPERVAEYQRAYMASDKGRVVARAKTLRRFNVTPEWYDATLAQQGGVCAICKEPETFRHRGRGEVVALSIDHDHACCPGTGSCGGCVRGLLCDRCNHKRLPEDPVLLRAAADYFERYK